jgi:hypothetical protein
LTNHAVVALVGQDVKQTRCTTCDTEHEYKHAKVPRQRRKSETPAVLYSQVLAGGPKRVVHDAEAPDEPVQPEPPAPDEVAAVPPPQSATIVEEPSGEEPIESEDAEAEAEAEEGPVHRQLIRATLPRQEGQPPPTRPAPDFTIRQPAGRPFRFRARHQQGGQQPFPGRSNGGTGGGAGRGGPPHQGNRPPMTSRLAKRHGPGRKRSK